MAARGRLAASDEALRDEMRPVEAIERERSILLLRGQRKEGSQYQLSRVASGVRHKTGHETHIQKGMRVDSWVVAEWE